MYFAKRPLDFSNNFFENEHDKRHDLINLFLESNYFVGRTRWISINFYNGITAKKWIHGNINDH